MGGVGSPFCEHKKLRTGCPICRPATLHATSEVKVVPFVSQEERENAAERRERRAAAAEERGETATAAEKKLRPTGPGKPLLPQRKRANRNISAAEADSVKPWWVKK